MKKVINTKLSTSSSPRWTLFSFRSCTIRAPRISGHSRTCKAVLCRTGGDHSLVQILFGNQPPVDLLISDSPNPIRIELAQTHEGKPDMIGRVVWSSFYLESHDTDRAVVSLGLLCASELQMNTNKCSPRDSEFWYRVALIDSCPVTNSGPPCAFMHP